MEVTFTKLPGRRYEMAVVRERGPVLAPRTGPGYHEYLPHDAVHFLVEAEAGLSGGAFGRAGECVAGRSAAASRATDMPLEDGNAAAAGWADDSLGAV